MRRGAWVLGLWLVGCGTGAAPAGGDRDLPSAESGPFRVLRKDELTSAPFVLDRSPPWEAPAALPTGDGLGVTLYVSWGKPSRITRFEAPDGRTIKSSGDKVLVASEPWEEADGVGHPAVIREDVEVWMFYASGGCVGRAVSSDGGVTFAKNPLTPVLCGEAGWEGGALGAPTVHRGHDGRLHLLYQAGGALGEAVSDDGVSFQRVGTGPLLTAVSAPALAEGATLDEVFDSATVGEPFAEIDTSPLGRPVTRVFYSATNRLGRTAIGLSAREGDAGVLVRNAAPVLSRYDARGPSVVKLGGVSMMYAAGHSSEAASSWKWVIIGALAPADRALPLP